MPNRPRVTPKPPAQTGPGVDATGAPIPDPTANVLALVEAAVQRLDDLRKESVEARNIGLDHLKEIVTLRAEYTEKLTLAEAKRIDAIRAVDVNAVSVASERAAQAASILATQVQASAETLRALVASTAANQAQQSSQQYNQLSDRITILERGAYEGVGKTRVVDPQIADMAAEITALRSFRSERMGSGSGMNALYGWIIGGVGLMATIVTVAVMLSR